MHIKQGRIGGAEPLKYSLASPEFHAVLEVKVENPYRLSYHNALMNGTCVFLMLSVYRLRDKDEMKRGEKAM